MKPLILVYSQITSAEIAESLGQADYSYHFVLQAFRPMLETIGRVVQVFDRADGLRSQVEPLVREGGPCVLLSFAPPNKTPVDLSCPVVPVFAWEYNSIPDEEFAGDWRNDWTQVLGKVAAMITHSRFAADTVRKALGQQLCIASIPAPVWDALQDDSQRAEPAPVKDLNLQLSLTVIDTEAFEVAPDRIFPDPARAAARGNRYGFPWSGGDLDYRFNAAADAPLLFGFYARESWGVWSQTDAPWMMLPLTVSGTVAMELDLIAHGATIGREISLRLGDKDIPLRATGDMTTYKLQLHLDRPTNMLGFTGLDNRVQEDAQDPRTMAIGIAALRICRRSETPLQDPVVEPSVPVERRACLRLSGVIYTAVINPNDGRKNWGDLVTGFCTAFRDRSDVTLCLKMTYSNRFYYMQEVFSYLSKLAPFRCRVLILHGYLEDEEYKALLRASSFFVNASRGEGQCLPLMESMALGIPCIAPTNTALAEYVDEECAFPLVSAPEPSFWPQDPRQLLKTQWHRINWRSLRDAYLLSYQVACESAQCYAAMSAAARESSRRFCSSAVLRPRLETLLRHVLSRGEDG